MKYWATFLCFQKISDSESYRKFVSTIFKLCGSVSTTDEVNGIVKLEDSFLTVRIFSIVLSVCLMSVGDLTSVKKSYDSLYLNIYH